MVINSVCTYCGVGCDISAEVENNEVQKISGGGGIVSGGNLCIKGKEGFEFLNSPNRILTPRIKKSFIEKNREILPKDIDRDLKERDKDYFEIDLNLAYDIVASKFKEIKAKYGRKSIAGIGGARTNCESSYTFQKFIREAIESPHIDSCARICHSPSLKGLKEVIGEGASSNPFDDILKAEFLIIIGSNTTEGHPIVSNRVIKAINSGVNLALFDIRDITLSKFAKYNCVIPYETNLLVLNMIAYVILKEELYNKEFIRNRVKRFEEYKEAILNDEYANPEFFKNIKSYEYLADLIPEVAREYASKKSIIMWGLGISEHIDGSRSVMAIANLAIITGNIGKSGAGVMPLRGQNNVQGTCDMGTLPYYTPDYTTPKEIGLMTPDIVEEMLSGGIKAIYNLGEDLAHVHPNQNKMHKALSNLEFLVVNELFPNEITKFADIIFGVKSAYEKRGVYINAERRLHLSTPLVESTLPDDWEVLSEIAKRLGSEFNYQNSNEVWDEVREVASSRFSGASYEKLQANIKDGLQWPIKESGTPVLHLDSFRTEDGLATPIYSKWQKRGMVKELMEHEFHYLSNEFFYLSTGRILEHYNNSAQTKEVLKLVEKYREDILLVSILDEDKIKSDRVILKSEYGESAPLKVKFTKKIKKGTLFTTFHHPKSRVNFLFGDEHDEFVKTANFKSLKVKVVNL